MKKERQVTLEDGAMKWYIVQRSCSVNVRGAEKKRAAEKVTKHKKIISEATQQMPLKFLKVA